MQTVICDRCKKQLSSQNVFGHIDRIRAYHIEKGFLIDKKIKERTLDLCGDCTNDFFMHIEK